MIMIDIVMVMMRSGLVDGMVIMVMIMIYI